MLLNHLLVSALSVQNIRCEYMSNPIGVDNEKPRLSWQLISDLRADKQIAYELLVSSSIENLAKNDGDLWDSGKVQTDQSIQLLYMGKALKSMQYCYWKVRVYDKFDKASDWSKPAFWGMGILSNQDWKNAKWIAYKDGDLWKKEWKQHKDSELGHLPPLKGRLVSWPWFTGKDSTVFSLYEMAKPKYDATPLFRKEFSIPQNIKSAHLFICGLGYYEAFINGQKVGNHVLDPAWTNYDKRSMYVTYNVTNQIKKGDNAIGIMLGRGQYNPLCNDIWKLSQSSWVDQLKVIALLHINYTDGTSAEIITDNSWKTAGGPIVYDDTRHGELYDARLEQKGWSKPAFNEKQWKSVSTVNWNASLVSQMMPPIRAFDEILPLKTIRKEPGIMVYDIGKNIAGWAKVQVKGKVGDRILVEYSETPGDMELISTLTPWRFKHTIKDKHYASFYDKAVNVRQQNGYILNGGETETFECHFSYKGFQYIRVTSYDGASIGKVVGVPVHTDVETVGGFACSNPVVNQLQKMSINSLLSNFQGISTDCPHREKQGWTADVYMSSTAAMYNFNMAAFYSKWLTDLADTQDSKGFLGFVAPSSNTSSNGSTVWPAALVILSSQLYQFYADILPISKNIDVMHRFAKSSMLNQVEGKPEIIKDVLGDWVSPLMELNDTTKCNTMSPPEGNSVYGTASHYLVVKKLAEMDKTMGLHTLATEMEDWAKRISTSFNAEFYNPISYIYHGEKSTGYRQSPNVVALQYGLVPIENKEAVINNLVADLHKKDDRIGTGFIGTAALMNFLPIVNPELAFVVATQKKYPGWGFMVAQGANTMWETWDGYSSRNHPPFCLISEYFYRYLAGIQNDESAPGFKHFIIHPSIVGDLKYVDAHYETMYGCIKSSWKKERNKLNMTIFIPVNTTAIVYVKSKQDGLILEGGKDVKLAKGVDFISKENGQTLFKVQSGNYVFQSEI
jgi:alpha-L-rhamnosidase